MKRGIYGGTEFEFAHVACPCVEARGVDLVKERPGYRGGGSSHGDEKN